jgi:hypothetical protein
MKTKKFSRRLELNKKTVANLDVKVMGKVKGGNSIITNCTCGYCETESCNTICFLPETLCICTNTSPVSFCPCN